MLLPGTFLGVWNLLQISGREIWIAVSAYVLVAIVKKRLHFSASRYEILQILSLTMFEKIPWINYLHKR